MSVILKSPFDVWLLGSCAEISHDTLVCEINPFDEWSAGMQIWSNCRTYNDDPELPIRELCTKAEAEVASQWAKQGLSPSVIPSSPLGAVHIPRGKRKQVATC